ncbi:MAG: glycosyltransferase family 2 protein [Candidatus Omnitrophota bacterium]
MRCDIIMPVWNNLTLTADCIRSVFEKTGKDYRLILVDNASDEETARYLEGLRDKSPVDVMLIRNKENLGFVKAVNQGERSSEAPYICVLNNDTLVTEGWLEEMIRIARSDPSIGVVNPSSNNLGQKPQQGEPIDIYARSIRKGAGRSVELGAAIGFCMLIKREVVGRIGLFDEIYGMGNFEDTDFSRRAIREGYRCVRALGAYVYHREHSSFRRSRTFESDFKRNREIYEFRWGRPRRIAYILDSCDDLFMQRLRSELLRLARDGNWIWYFSRGHIDIPEHSNIISCEIEPKRFYPKMLYRILTKKKRFNDIFIGGERTGRLLESLSFIHRAKVHYY